MDNTFSGSQVHLGGGHAESAHGAAPDPGQLQLDGLHQKMDQLLNKMMEMDRKIDTLNVELIHVRQEIYGLKK